MKVRLLKTSHQTLLLFYFSKSYLNFPTLLVKIFVIRNRDGSVFSTWNNRRIVLRQKRLTIPIAIIALVRQNMTTVDVFGQFICKTNVVCVAPTEHSFNHLKTARNQEVKLCGYACDAFALSLKPPFKPPP